MKKINIRFNLRVDKVSGKDKMAPVMGTFTFDNKRGRFKTDIRLPQAAWDKKRGEVKSSYANSFATNKRLSEIKFNIREIYNTTIESGKKVSPEYIKKELENSLYGTNNKTPKSLNDYFQEWIETSEKTHVKGTITTYKSTLLHLKNFQEIYQLRLSLEDIDHEFKENFIVYLTSCVRRKNGSVGLTNSTVGKTFKVITTFMNACVDKEYTQNLKYLKFKVPKKIETKRFALNQQEIERICDLNLNKEPHLQISKDIFLFCCYTGLRYSDIITLKKGHIKKVKNSKGEDFYIIEKVMDKTHREVKIPLFPIPLEILEKYNFEEERNTIFNLKVLKNINLDLKEIGRKAKLNALIIKKVKRGSKSDEHVFKKYELLTMHIGRYTFASILSNKSLPITYVKDLMGHEKIDTTMGYVNIDQDLKLESVLSAFK